MVALFAYEEFSMWFGNFGILQYLLILGMYLMGERYHSTSHTVPNSL